MRESWARYHRYFRLKEMNKWVSTREPGLPSEPVWYGVMPRGAEGVATRSRGLTAKKWVSRERSHFPFSLRNLGFLRLWGDFVSGSRAGDFLDQFVVGVTRKRSQVSLNHSEDEIASIWSREVSRLRKSIWGFRLRVGNREGGFDFLVKIDIRFLFRVRLSWISFRFGGFV